MKTIAILAIVASLILGDCGSVPAASQGLPGTGDLGGSIRVLDINLCVYMPNHSEKERLDKVRQFIETNNVDICTFQEGLDVCWPIYESPRILCPATYYMYHHYYIGVLWFYTFEVGVVSRYPIISINAANIEVPNANAGLDDMLDRIPLPGATRTVLITVNVPGYGIVNVASVHMASNPATPADRNAQFAKLASFLNQYSGTMILGGDFNTDLTCPGIASLTNLGLAPMGIGATNCDFIFGRGVSMISGTLVLNDGTITDHAGGWLVDVGK
jgi:endonuclease/exonuclease/phosphatase family metal-dependent hydrolase